MNQSRKREFKAPWKEPEQSIHETVTTPAHLSQKWMDTFSFGEKSRKSRLFDQESKETQKQSDTMGSQKQRIASQLLQSLHEKEPSSQRGFHGFPSEGKDVSTEQIMKRFDDVDQKMQTVLDTIKTISGVLEDIQRGQKDPESMNAIIERVSNAVMTFHAQRHGEEDHHCFGETHVEHQEPQDEKSREKMNKKQRVGTYIKERERKKFKRDSRVLRVASQESCSSRTW